MTGSAIRTENAKKGWRICIPSPEKSKGGSLSVTSLRNGKMIIKVSDVKECVSERCRVSEEFYYELDRQVREKIEEAARRAKKNGRRTLKPYDL